MVLSVGLVLGPTDGAVLVVGFCEGRRLGLAEGDGVPVGMLLGCPEIEGCAIGPLEGDAGNE